MQNSLNKEGNILEFATKSADTAKGVSIPSELSNHNITVSEAAISPNIKPINAQSVFVIKKDGTKEHFDPQKIINAVKKSATRALIEFTEGDLKSICDFVNNNIIRKVRKCDKIKKEKSDVNAIK